MIILMIVLLIHSNLKKKTPGQSGSNDVKCVEVMVLLNYLSNFWRTL